MGGHCGQGGHGGHGGPGGSGCWDGHGVFVWLGLSSW